MGRVHPRARRVHGTYCRWLWTTLGERSTPNKAGSSKSAFVVMESCTGTGDVFFKSIHLLYKETRDDTGAYIEHPCYE